MTLRQQRALGILWPQYGVEVGEEPLDFVSLFGRQAPCILEIGFGMGGSLFAMALNNPAYDFLGVEVHLPGIGTLLADIEEAKLRNLRVFYADAWDVLTHGIPAASLHRIQLFFPDPWPKSRHHKRRLLTLPFARLLAEKLSPNGSCLHVATDLEPYAQAMLNTLEDLSKQSESQLYNVAGPGQFVETPAYRPITKYEKRGRCLGHGVWDLIFGKSHKTLHPESGVVPLS